MYAVQNCKVSYFGLYPSSGIYDKNHNVSETGSVSVLRWMVFLSYIPDVG
jgi:hypothetical protein